MGLKRSDVVEMHIIDEGQGPKAAAVDSGDVDTPLNWTLAKAKVSPGAVIKLIEDYFAQVVRIRLDKMDLDTMIEMHSESAIERAIQGFIANGWDDRTITGDVSHKIREMVSKDVEKNLTIDVEVRVSMKSPALRGPAEEDHSA